MIEELLAYVTQQEDYYYNVKNADIMDIAKATTYQTIRYKIEELKEQEYIAKICTVVPQE